MEGDKVDGAKDHEWDRLSDCWLLGDKLQSSSLQDAVADALCSKMRDEGRYPLGVHRKAYAKTASSNTLRQLAVDVAAYKWTEQSLKIQQEDSSWNTFFFDLAVEMKGMSDQDRKGSGPLSKIGCAYHVHGSAKPCYMAMF
ncbi:hypothetical protein CLAFUW4_14109 [Fulvia fulva]|uniref:Uncharacterized protein n=1 Tax=Passalora fulva TaxID=5499 RepID=A0A9Q8PL27_PASFU|nr:uncharacterized protein CLAFUR5_13944 [Fulvia fulva]KAK4610343.1 hypothetical protein CLAFUR4_14112 [Fulvia fulva]KAK4611283.1 hypothetical protein CLAFUR0_14116 [Fulvia fulva]UJO24465.1 hypothetical protein CLAFUR5_13944 [Fulvia fulva]WPV22237.1 hypothetical protein CLAFUW4_14109 [Fulvia fulva]WPV37349.1 hypothetical protein CLAFUW7_14120 [Fulvia fulva]